MAVEHNGKDAALGFVEKAGATFPVVADENGLLVRQLGFKVVPNGVLLDQRGIIRYAKYGGFSIGNEEDVSAVERFIKGEEAGPSPQTSDAYTLSVTERELVETRLRLGRLLASSGHKEAAILEWQAALRVDPQNFVIRKQIWSARYPEKFYPTIDFEWQKGQLAREQHQEIVAGICGPDGCPLPPR